MADSSCEKGGSSRFHETHWTMVLRAAGDDTVAETALQDLCQVYWYPLYAYVRRQGRNQHDAEDLTQAFFARLLAKGDLDKVDREKGKFRSFLLAAVKNFLANEWDRSQAQKRGGGQQHLSIDFQDAESRYAIEPAHEITPDKLYERRWAMTVLEQAIGKLRDEMVAQGKEEQFRLMKVFLTGGKGEVRYAEIAEQLGISEGAVKTGVHRLRKRYRTLLKEEVAETLSDEEDVDLELRSLLSALAGQ